MFLRNGERRVREKYWQSEIKSDREREKYWQSEIKSDREREKEKKKIDRDIIEGKGKKRREEREREMKER